MTKRRLKAVIALAVLGALAAGAVVFVLNRPIAIVVAEVGTQVPVRVSATERSRRAFSRGSASNSAAP